MLWRIEVKEKDGLLDPLGEGTQKDILDIGVKGISQVRVSQVYLIEGDIQDADVEKISRELLADPVTQDYQCSSNGFAKFIPSFKVVEIAYNPGVMDPVEESTLKGIRDLGIPTVTSVRTARKYYLYGKLSSRDLNLIVDKVLANKLIQHVVKEPHGKGQASLKPVAKPKDSPFHVVLVDLLKANPKELKQLSQKGQLFLNLDEMKAIQQHFRSLKRDPTDCELETIAQTWSEHCYHKTFRGNIEYTSQEKGHKKTRVIRNLLKSTIVKATYKLNKPWCVSVFHDNAGVIEFDEDFHVCFKVETHNHPSALEPFGGANTGVGGVIRDTLGTGLGAKPICNTDIFCFAPPDYSSSRLPPGTLHPKRVMKGVVSGVRDYGNKMGIPTVNGAILFDERFVGNPLVYCGNVGLLPKGAEKKAVHKNDKIVTVGGRTGRDGIHGATFSSGELTEESETISSGAVQIGHPIQEKKVLDALLKARDEGLYHAITDCGAGGFSSAVGEMANELGARVDLEKILLKYEGLTYTERWISESQERMVLAVAPEYVERLLAVFQEENVEATVIGEFTGSERLELFYHGCQVCDLDVKFLHDGPPRLHKKAIWKPTRLKEPKISSSESLNEFLFAVLSHNNVASKESVIRQYDHEVQGASVIKPLSGVNSDGPSDASVLAPRWNSQKGIAVANGINVRFGMIDPYWMAASCIDEAVRQIISVGGELDRIAILDNFCWGNPDKPDRLGGLVRCALGCHDAAIALGVPFISGKDSLYNEFAQGGKSIAIPGTILISSIGIVEDVTKTVTMDFKKGGNLIYVVGKTYPELGGSIYYDILGHLGSAVPTVRFKKAVKTFQAMNKVVQSGYARSIHDCSEGGVGVALAEMCFSGEKGATVHLKRIPYEGKNRRDDFVLFSESNSRFVVEVEPRHQKAFEATLKGVVHCCIGQVEETPEVVVYGLDDQICVNAYQQDLKDVWKSALKF
ncbi:MAG: phosphoribosylformylglycinamidine synthase subunit PurL [Candidatus Omnitrophica bacterium]|nr:phosphoribosylformylglycinamidine synthase subunit PurL [Candidatus Omnitrophota bacterium]